MRTLKIPPGPRVWATADTHYGHRNIVRYCLRYPLTEPQKTAIRAGEYVEITDAMLREHNDLLMDHLNSLVEPDDYLLHGGDHAWGETALKEFRGRLRCRHVYAIVGNHDDEDELARAYGADRVFERLAVDHAGSKAVLDHYGGDAWFEAHKGRWLLFGHAHGVSDVRRSHNPAWLLSKDVGVDGHNLRPWEWRRELVPFFDARFPRWCEWKNDLMRQRKDHGGMTRPEPQLIVIKPRVLDGPAA